MTSPSIISSRSGVVVPAVAAVAVGAIAASLHLLAHWFSKTKRRKRGVDTADDDGRYNPNPSITKGGYESLIGNTPLVYLPSISSLLPNKVKVFVKMESMNPGGTGKDRAAMSMILNAERRGELPPPLDRTRTGTPDADGSSDNIRINGTAQTSTPTNTTQADKLDGKNINHQSSSSDSSIPSHIHDAILTALHKTKTNGILIEGTSGSTGISLASISCARGHGVIVIMPDDQSKQKSDFLKKLGCGVVVVQNCSISNPGHYVNVARRVWEWLQVERRYDGYYWENIACKSRNEHERSDIMVNGKGQSTTKPSLIQAAFMNQFENPANVLSHYTTTGPEIYSQLDGKVDAFVMSAGTGGTLVGVGGYLKERWWQNHYRRSEQSQRNVQGDSLPPKIVLVDPPGSSLFNKVKFGVAYAAQQSEQKLRRHRYDTLAEGIGLDRVTANFGLGCDNIFWNNVCEDEKGVATFGNRITRLMNISNATHHDHTNDQHHQQTMTQPMSNQSKIIDDALSITDQQAVYMAHYLLRHEGLFVGSSSAMNVAGALMVASQMPPGSNVVTVICDGGQRHTSRFWNRDFIVNEWGLVWPGDADAEDDGQAIGTNNNGEENILKQLGISLGSIH